MSTRTEHLKHKNYFIPTNTVTDLSNREWLSFSGGLRESPISLKDFKRSLEKAKRCFSCYVIVPENSLNHPDFLEMISLSQTESLQFVVQVTATTLILKKQKLCNLVHSQRIFLDIVLNEWSAALEAIVEELPQNAVRFILPGVKPFAVWKKLDSISQSWISRLYLYFPYRAAKKSLFSPIEVFNLIKQLQIIFPAFRIQTLIGLDLFEDRIDPREDLESLIEPIINFRGIAPLLDQLKVSVVIPSFNDCERLLKTLQHLQMQKNVEGLFEVIVVDDGSTDETSKKLLEDFPKYSFAFKYLYYPRMKPRTMGDAQFRAGRARNLGVKWSEGEILAFLDSDILVPDIYIQEILRLHQNHDVVQWRREHLTKERSINASYESIDHRVDRFIPEGGYWHRFYEKCASVSWPMVEDYWKYTCTYALSLPKDIFLKSGGFRRTYCFYGCEDTELGLQLKKMGVRFYLQNLPVLHLFHEEKRSEFLNSFVRRHRLLKQSAVILYYNTLDPDVFRVFQYILDPQGLKNKTLSLMMKWF